MPFAGNVVLCEPFLRGALQHPNKALFNFGSPKTTMSTRYHGTLLDHLADFTIYLSSASSFWFSLNSSYEHGCHLSKQYGMTPKDYEYLLVIVVGAVIVADVIVPLAVIALAFVLRCPLILLLCQLVIACCFASVAGIFTAHPSFG
jgi:hypothetical protein